MKQSTLEPTALPVRPRLAADVLVHPPSAEGAPWVVERDGRRYFRVGADLAKLAQHLTGDYNLRELHVVLGHPWTPEVLGAAVRQLGDMKLLDDGERHAMRRRRVAVVPPFSVQFTVLDPSRVLGRVGLLLRILAARSTLLCLAVLVASGIVTLGAQSGTLFRLASSPVTPVAFAVLFFGNFTATIVHELAHGAVLTWYGGKARRMGFMLFYLVPAFFCDVSDGWRLPRNAMRVQVALAGIAAQLVLGGATAVSSLLMPSQAAADSLLLLSFAIYFAASINIVPFVKFDGYLALMSHLDISDLREKAMTDARSFLARLLFGAALVERRLPGRRWVLPYGLTCLTFPLFLIGFMGLHLWSEVLARMGYVGALLNASLLTLLVAGVARELLRIHRITGKPFAPRVVLADALLVVAATVLLTQVHLTRTIPAGYAVEGGRAWLYVASASDARHVAEGQQVVLKENGVLWRPPTGSGEVVGARGTTEVPITASMPVALDLDLTTRVAAFELEMNQPPRSNQGVASVVVGDRNLGHWLVDTYLAPLW